MARNENSFRVSSQATTSPTAYRHIFHFLLFYFMHKHKHKAEGIIIMTQNNAQFTFSSSVDIIVRHSVVGKYIASPIETRCKPRTVTLTQLHNCTAAQAMRRIGETKRHFKLLLLCKCEHIERSNEIVADCRNVRPYAAWPHASVDSVPIVVIRIYKFVGKPFTQSLP